MPASQSLPAGPVDIRDLGMATILRRHQAATAHAASATPPVSPTLKKSFKALFGDRNETITDDDADDFLSRLVTFARDEVSDARSEQAAREAAEQEAARDRFLATTHVGRYAIELRRQREGKA